jgi:catechol 2,3-dioxygenase-like lactoylglutathione lyase family enzyme
MARASISHISLTVSDLNRSAEFYDRIFKFMGYLAVEVPESTQQAMNTRLKAWVGPGYSISIRPSNGEFAHRRHDRNAPGFNHMAFYAEDRSDIDAMYNLLKEIGAQVLDPPAEYPYSPGYVAVYFADPDGLKFEFAYVPGE